MGKNGDIFAVSKVFNDTYSSFIDGSIKSTEDLFEWLDTKAGKLTSFHRGDLTTLKAESHSYIFENLLRGGFCAVFVRRTVLCRKDLISGCH